MNTRQACKIIKKETDKVNDIKQKGGKYDWVGASKNPRIAKAVRIMERR